MISIIDEKCKKEHATGENVLVRYYELLKSFSLIDRHETTIRLSDWLPFSCPGHPHFFTYQGTVRRSATGYLSEFGKKYLLSGMDSVVGMSK